MEAMEVLHRCCCGMDVHKDSVVACVRRIDARGPGRRSSGTFGTTTAGLLELGDWLVSEQVPIAAMESTGVYWKPIWNLLEGHELKLLLVNAHDVEQLPGRKTDVKDSQWLGATLELRALRASFVPQRPQRELRDLTRTRTSSCCRTSGAGGQPAAEGVGGRQHQAGKRGQRRAGGLGAGHDPSADRGEDVARADGGSASGIGCGRRSRSWCSALRGEVREHHRFMLGLLLDPVEHLERQVGAARCADRGGDEPFGESGGGGAR